jgi:hypothetical protein
MNAYIASVKTNSNTNVSTQDSIIVSYNDLMNDKKYAEVKGRVESDTRKGRGFYIAPDEEISFYSLDKAIVIVNGFEIWNKTVRAICSVHAYSSKGRGLIFPMSELRKMFASEEFEIEGENIDPNKWFYEDNDLGHLASNAYSDLDRIREVAGKTIKQSGAEQLEFWKIASSEEGARPERTGDKIKQYVRKYKIVK